MNDTRAGMAFPDDSSSDVVGLDHEDREDLLDEDIHTHVPSPPFRLGYRTTICIIINRMIGTGIFKTPHTVIYSTESTGITLIFWFAGALAAFAASYVYVEFGLNTPRFYVPGLAYKVGVPRSGCELNYLRYVYRWPAYLSTCIFGVAFIIFGNVAGNCVAFAQFVFIAAGKAPEEVPQAPVRAIAIGVATFACAIHSFSRRWGIRLSDFLAFVKIGILLFIIITGFCAYGGVFHTANFADENLSPDKSFETKQTDTYSYASAFLSVLFAYGGYSQANLVLSEIRNPRKVFTRSVAFAVTLVSILYMLVNIVYMLVVPKKGQINVDTAELFFQNTIGRLSDDRNIPLRVLNAFLALSSLGNIIIMTFTAGRVKQEIAKEGILPFPKFFGSGYDWSIRRLFNILRGRKEPPSHLNQTPVGGLILHWIFVVILILASIPLSDEDTYSLITGIPAYLFFALFPAALGAGLLYLRFNPRIGWRFKTPGFHTVPSVISAVVILVAGLFPVVVKFVKPSGEWDPGFPWYSVPVIAWAVLGLGVVYWFVFRFIVPRFGHRQGKRFLVEKEQHFTQDDGYPVLEHEIVRIRWVLPESLEDGTRPIEEFIEPKRDSWASQNRYPAR